MSLWHRLFRRHPPADTEPAAEPSPADDQLIELPTEPFVFECRECGKVFEARRKKPLCPECDSRNVELVSA
ncbi:MAG TPA: hydrogenase/urease maturation nickel metallochaperone HypA [Candidatus Kryptonia bacterium]|nr:hydrogenase/urease maturation nickel metallochaperone HypA [Candidatus Kryptonia bacterium]